MQFPKKTDFVEKQKESILANLEVKSSVLAAKVNEKLTKAVKLPVVVYFDKEHIIHGALRRMTYLDSSKPSFSTLLTPW